MDETTPTRESNQIRFGFIMFENHPYGRVILQELIKNGYVPTVCIEERSETGVKRCKWYNKQLSSFNVPLVEDLLKSVPFNRVIVEDQNNNVTKNALMEANLDVIFLGGAGNLLYLFIILIYNSYLYEFI
jgi:hypothetical protein